MKRSELIPSCKFNHGVECSVQGPCEHCGWNPEEEQRRNNLILQNDPDRGMQRLIIEREEIQFGNSDI